MNFLIAPETNNLAANDFVQTHRHIALGQKLEKSASHCSIRIQSEFPHSINIMSAITTHILDTSRGKAAAGVAVTLHRAGASDNNAWQLVGSGRTNAEGRCADLITSAGVFDESASAVYKLHFEVASYFAEHSVDAFYPHVEVSVF